jgi:hypothetical protein
MNRFGLSPAQIRLVLSIFLDWGPGSATITVIASDPIRIEWAYG